MTEQEFGSDGQVHPVEHLPAVEGASAPPNDTFETTTRCDTRFPNDFHEWPSPYREASDGAVKRLLSQHPGVGVLSDTSEVIDDTHPRFPVGEEHKGKFWAVRTIVLDRPVIDAFEAAEPASAAQRMRAFEDEHLGAEAPRIDGKIERGHGSLFSRLSPDQRARHAKIEHLAHAEDKVAQAAEKLSEAQVGHAQAVAALEEPDESKNGSG